MKKLGVSLITVIFLVALAAVGVNAQMGQGQGMHGAMKGMGRGMMNCPMMEGKMQMGSHHGPADKAPAKTKARKTVYLQ